ncbi:hypothetical protein CLV63_11246 [Murinocardiopsis flavida]|uniref:TadE-like protein n=1 Tax=Murinocardiopsis flavida TaxID=645275 RepID=A0A2P8DG28_9ACTN|nr:hypothetical protein [Murinocardiopsis flavida]PSK96164.1 hypothetical protein CLV63_11246 [Murinocardiopsis flavida]
MTPLRTVLRRWGRRGDAGSAEIILTLPLCLLLLLLVVQVAVWAHAQHRTQAIATHTLSALRAADATPATGRARAEELRGDLGGDLLRGVEIEVERGPDTARVSVGARIIGPLPGWKPRTRAEMHAPVEAPPGPEGAR